MAGGGHAKPARWRAITRRCWPWMSATGALPACYCAINDREGRAGRRYLDHQCHRPLGGPVVPAFAASRRRNPWSEGSADRTSCCPASPALPTPLCTPRRWTSVRFLSSRGTNRCWSAQPRLQTRAIRRRSNPRPGGDRLPGALPAASVSRRQVDRLPTFVTPSPECGLCPSRPRKRRRQ